MLLLKVLPDRASERLTYTASRSRCLLRSVVSLLDLCSQPQIVTEAAIS